MQIVHNQLSHFNNVLGGSISSFQGDRILQYDNDKGTGRIQTVSLGSGISYTEYDLDLNDDFNFDLKLDENRCLYFIYCLEGSFRFSKGKEISKVEALQTVVIGGSNETINIKLREATKSNLSIIKVTQDGESLSKNVNNNELYEQLFASFLNEDGSAHIGTFNLKIKEQLLQIRSITQVGLVRKLLIEGIVNFTLALEILHCKQDIENSGQVSTMLTKKELLRIEEAVNAIKRKPEFPYTVTDLSKEYGLSPTKLQEGFKVMEGTTVTNFIRNERLILAEELIQTSDMNISEIVYSIGFTSRSYFSKIFRNKFKCTPKAYLMNIRNVSLSA
ncbi:AraC family transcriptional regulator [Maribacter caenipelagi]|jgi:AraC-like DNA-binding protein|uniref:AraC family transcriptional regulator n=1 Tax=Maribacter caenipelagi TaxID=1447781 RepID=A0A4R7CZX3_9FLAO|nr:AraC family transcriptional regulator [Maribacter caenipelagi]TDS12026.1 AraC family transcriptional regulator [Maribacter caenipelagi]